VSNNLRGSILTLPERAKAAARVAPRRALAVAADSVVASARQQWPVSTGRSRAALGATTRDEGVAIVDTAEYALEILSRGVRPWDAYVLTPLRLALQDQIPRAVAAELVREVSGG
jgi:hypothetical protein